MLDSPLLRTLNALPHKPALLLIILNILVGVITFRDFGFALDERLFYGYADAIGYAYSPREWLSGDFQLERAYGPSPWDHANRGPAYLLLARGPAHLLQTAGLDQASAWHLVNFLAFQAGVFFFYVLCRRWMTPWAAFAATAFFCAQPVLWEHAFINPKDPPFLVFFLISLELGFRMVDHLTEDGPEPALRTLRSVIVPALTLGLATSIRILGPFAGALVVLYFLLKNNPRQWMWLAVYAALAILTMIVSWPFLWEGPVVRFIETARFMAGNPTELRVLFYGNLYRANDLPLRYLPALFLFTLTEPVWPLALIGGIAAVWRVARAGLEWRSLLSTFLWFIVPLAFVLWKRPPMYDGFRHFMFILPPIFVLSGLAMDSLFQRVRSSVFRASAVVILIAPGLIAGAELHPYEYAYYNQFVGGTDKAAFDFETDYWLTCYKEAVEKFNPSAPHSRTLFVRREGYLAAYYALPGVRIVDTSRSSENPQPGDYFLDHSRANPGLQRLRQHHNFTLVSRDHAVFCAIGKYTEK